MIALFLPLPGFCGSSLTPGISTPETPTLTPQPETRPISATLEAGWYSRYVSEGIDVWPGSGMYVLGAEINYRGMIASLWQGVSDHNSADREFKFLLGYELRLAEAWTLTPSWEHSMTFPHHGNTPAIELDWKFAPGWEASAVAQWFCLAGRFQGYYTAGIQYSRNLAQTLEASLGCSYSFNEGFLCADDLGVDPGGDIYGNCNIDYAFTLNWKFARHTALHASINYSQALRVLERAGLGNCFWFHAGLTFQF